MDTSIKYTGLQQPYLDDSSIDETLIDDEKDSSFFTSNIGSTPRSAYARAASFLSTVRWFIDTLLIVTILILLLRQQKSIARLPTSSEHEVGGDFTGVSPHFSTEIKTFKVNQTFAPYNTSEFFQEGVLEAWNELMPHGIGFQWVNDTKRYHDLPHPIVWPNKTVFTTSFTHQLHCLYAIVQTYSGLKSNTTLEDDHHWHMIHCFDYMRQAIMCNADMALEGLETTFPDHNGGSDGWDSKHVCKNYDEVIGYLESVRAYDAQQIY